MIWDVDTDLGVPCMKGPKRVEDLRIRGKKEEVWAVSKGCSL
jgi:hypothetical protein